MKGCHFPYFSPVPPCSSACPILFSPPPPAQAVGPTFLSGRGARRSVQKLNCNACGCCSRNHGGRLGGWRGSEGGVPPVGPVEGCRPGRRYKSLFLRGNEVGRERSDVYCVSQGSGPGFCRRRVAVSFPRPAPPSSSWSPLQPRLSC